MIKNFLNMWLREDQYSIGSFRVEWIHTTHSIVDACSLAIETPIGTLIHTADFKIDHTPIDGYTAIYIDLHIMVPKGYYVYFLIHNSHKSGYTKSESVVGKTFDTLFEQAKGRVIMSTFSSNVHRIFQAMERGVKHNRKICVIGRSMERNIDTARRLGYINIDERHFIDAHEVIVIRIVKF